MVEHIILEVRPRRASIHAQHGVTAIDVVNVIQPDKIGRTITFPGSSTRAVDCGAIVELLERIVDGVVLNNIPIQIITEG